jgi:hypothetical protein
LDFNADAIWPLDSSDLAIVSMGIDRCKGKSSLINEMFLTNFEESDGSIYFNGTVDMQTNKYFKNDRRIFNVADAHGILPEQIK